LDTILDSKHNETTYSLCYSAYRHTCKALALVGLVVKGPGRAAITEKRGWVPDVALLTDAGCKRGLARRKREGVGRARGAVTVTLECLIEPRAAADALCHIVTSGLEAGCAHAGTGASVGAHVEVGKTYASAGVYRG